eukprot:7718939-Alexandrium_andersonii.AAC.1
MRCGPVRAPVTRVSCLAADGGRVPNRGEAQLGLITKEHHRCRAAFQVADAKPPLLAVSALTKA